MPKKKAASKDPNVEDQPPSKKVKQASYTTVEDECLTRTWCKATLNEIQGNYQDERKYWSKLAESYNKVMTNDHKMPARSIDSLQARWRKINHNCTKFNGIYMGLKRLQKSGYTEDDYISETQKTYKAETKSNFSLLSCWCIIKDHPKWSLGIKSIRDLISNNDIEDLSCSSTDKPPSSSKSSTPRNSTPNTGITSSGERPRGQKAAKAAVKNELALKSIEEMNALSMKKRAEAHADSVLFNIMGRLGPDNPLAKQWYEMKAKEAVDELMNKMKPKKKELFLNDLIEKPAAEEAQDIVTANDSQGNDESQEAVESVQVEGDELELEIEIPVGEVDCCAGEYCIIGSSNPALKIDAKCNKCERLCHIDCCIGLFDDYTCNLCDKNEKIMRL